MSAVAEAGVWYNTTLKSMEFTAEIDLRLLYERFQFGVMSPLVTFDSKVWVETHALHPPTHTDVDARTCSGPKHPAAAYTNSSCVQTHVLRRQGVFRRKDAHVWVKPFVNE